MPNLFHTAFDKYVSQCYPDGIAQDQRRHIEQAFQSGAFSIVLGITTAKDEEALKESMARIIDDMGKLCAARKVERFTPTGALSYKKAQKAHPEVVLLASCPKCNAAAVIRGTCMKCGHRVEGAGRA